MRRHWFYYFLVSVSLLLATAGLAQQRPPEIKRQKMTVATPAPDSSMLRRQALVFIRKVRGYALGVSDYKLENKPASIEQMDCLKSVLADKLMFTPAERRAIEFAAKQKVAKWTTTEFATVKLLETDTINAIFKNWHKGWEYFYQHIGQNFNAYSYPIFIRNNTYCLFYTAMYCGGLCAEGNLILYRKTGQNWVEVKRYCSWVS